MPSPVIVFEVVSPASVQIDRVIKLREYQAVRSISSYILVDLEARTVTIHVRNRNGKLFRAETLAGTDILKLPEIGIELPIAAIYEGTGFAQEVGEQR